MKVPYDEINKALLQQLQGVELIPDPLGVHEYVLRFQEDNPSEDCMNEATRIVDQILPTDWHYDEMRTTK